VVDAWFARGGVTGRTRRELLHQRVHQLRGVSGRGPVADVDPCGHGLPLRETEEVDALFPDEVQVDRRPLSLELGDATPALANEIGVEGATQTAVRRDQQQRRAPNRAALGLPQQREILGELGGVQLRHHLGERGGVGPRPHDPVLRALQLGGGHHLHGARDLAGALYRADAPAQLARLRHLVPFQHDRTGDGSSLELHRRTQGPHET